MISRTRWSAGFYLDYTSAARYASLHYDTFAQLFTHHTRFDRAGEGQFVSATDDENLSPTTKLRFDEFFYRDAPTVTWDRHQRSGPEFNTVAAQLLLANDQASINQFSAALSHYWGRNWSSELARSSDDLLEQWRHQQQPTTIRATAKASSTFTEYHFSDRFSLGGGISILRFPIHRSGTTRRRGALAVREGWLAADAQTFISPELSALSIHIPRGTAGRRSMSGGMGLADIRFRARALEALRRPATGADVGLGRRPATFEEVRGTCALRFHAPSDRKRGRRLLSIERDWV